MEGDGRKHAGNPYGHVKLQVVSKPRSGLSQGPWGSEAATSACIQVTKQSYLFIPLWIFIQVLVGINKPCSSVVLGAIQSLQLQSPSHPWPDTTLACRRSLCKVSGSPYFLFIAITYLHSMIPTHLPVSLMSISPPLIMHSLSISDGDAWSIARAVPPQQESVMKKN